MDALQKGKKKGFRTDDERTRVRLLKHDMPNFLLSRVREESDAMTCV